MHDTRQAAIPEGQAEQSPEGGTYIPQAPSEGGLGPVHAGPSVVLGDTQFVGHLRIRQTPDLSEEEGPSLGSREGIECGRHHPKHGRIRDPFRNLSTGDIPTDHPLRDAGLGDPAGTVVGAYVGHDPAQPCPQVIVAAEAGEPTVGAFERLLNRVLGLEGRSQGSPCLGQEHTMVPTHDLRERIGIAGTMCFDKGSIGTHLGALAP